MPNFKDITGQRFGRLVALSVHELAHRFPKPTNTIWLCQCDCGQTTLVDRSALTSRLTASCGCLWREAITTHGKWRHPLYRVWSTMNQRCTNPNRKGYQNYGGRGIKVCQRWKHSFANFLADMGERPDGYTLERINNDGDYEPENCKWDTRQAQIRNQRKRTIAAEQIATQSGPQPPRNTSQAQQDETRPRNSKPRTLKLSNREPLPAKSVEQLEFEL